MNKWFTAMTGLFLLLANVTLASEKESATSVDTGKKAKSEVLDDVFVEMLEQASFLDLMDVNVALNPDWEADSPTKFAQKSSLSPAYVTVITKEDIRLFGYQSVADILSYVEGFVFTTDHTLPNFGARGLHPGARAGNRIFKVMIDGQSISFQANSNNWLDRNLIPLNLVERVEVTKGPASALYGADAFLGVINVVTKRSDEFMRRGNLAQVEVESIEAAGVGYGVSMIGGYKSEKWDTNWGAEFHYRDRGGLHLPVTSPDYGLHQQGEQSRVLSLDEDDSEPFSLYSKSQYQIDDKQKVRFAIHYQQQHEDHLYSDLAALRSTGGSHINLYNSFARIDYSNNLSEKWQLLSYLSYADGGSTDDDVIDLGTEQFYLKRQLDYQAWQLNSEASWQPSKDNYWLFGIDLQQGEYLVSRYTQVNADGSRSLFNNGVQTDSDNWAAYSQWFKQWTPNLSSLVGYRFDNHEVYRKQHSGRIGLVLSLNELQQLKLLFGTAFQAPSPELLYGQAVAEDDIAGNPNLKPQQAKGVELIFSGSHLEKWRYSASLYYNIIDDLVRYENRINNQVAANSGEATSLGFETSFSYRSDLLQLFANLSWQDTQVASNSIFELENRQLAELYPEWTVSGGFSYSLPRWNSQFYATARYMSQRAASTTNVLVVEADYSYTEVFVMEAGVYRNFENALGQSRLRLHIDNLFNQKHAHPGFNGIDTPDLGRIITLSYSQRF